MLQVVEKAQNNGKHAPAHAQRPPGMDSRNDAVALFVDPRNGARGLFDKEMKLPSPPAVAIKMLEAFKREHVSLDEISRIVSSDPALAVKVLKLANSPIYTRANKVETIKKAVAVLGTRTLKNIALSFVIVEGIHSSWSVSLDLETFWRRSITSAVATSLISGLLKHKDDDLFITALLQDIGVLVLNLHDAETYKALTHDMAPGSPIEEEEAAFGPDHQDVGSLLLREWNLPDNICELVRYHHALEDAPVALLPKLHVLHLANLLSSIFFADHSGHDYETFGQSLRSVHAASKEDIEQVISSAHQKTSEALAYFEISSGIMKTCQQILQEANEELGKLNMTYEQMVLELKAAKEEAEKYALKLAQANERLQQLAYRDPLTGLFNHGYFQEMLDRELKRAVRYERPLSLILFDLDHFKNVNDRYGHPAGDQVLKQVADLAVKSVRQCDYVARYGGEEFAIILPETGSAGAKTLGERIRKAIELSEIINEDHVIKVTVSIGAYTYCPVQSDASKSLIIAAADRALYLSKNMGRNKMSISSNC
jgi:diguanylate cyclase (GGDEF)-like protein